MNVVPLAAIKGGRAVELAWHTEEGKEVKGVDFNNIYICTYVYTYIHIIYICTYTHTYTQYIYIYKTGPADRLLEDSFPQNMCQGSMLIFGMASIESIVKKYSN